jgi:hypothetical protein
MIWLGNTHVTRFNACPYAVFLILRQFVFNFARTVPIDPFLLEKMRLILTNVYRQIDFEQKKLPARLSAFPRLSYHHVLLLSTFAQKERRPCRHPLAAFAIYVL